MDSFYNESELKKIGLKDFGNNVLISKKACFYNSEKISIGDNVRIDDFCILSGNIELGSYIHIAAYTALYGAKKGITVDDFSNISGRVSIYAICDDFSGESMTNPMIEDKYKNLQEEHISISKHVIIGCSSIILPGAKLEEGCALGAFSLLKEKTEPWYIYSGIPCKKIKTRSKNLLERAKNI